MTCSCTKRGNRRPTGARAGRFLVTAILLTAGARAQYSKPVADNTHIARNKFKQRDVSGVEDIVFGTDASRFDPRSACPQRIHQNWATEVEASAYVTPAIFDVASDGVKDVVIPTFIRHIEVIEGAHGQHVAGFPFTFPNSAFYASPIIFDVNLDGEPDIGVTSFNGELVWLSETGMPIFGKSLKIPHLRVKKDWYKGLKADPQDLEHTGLTEHEREALENQPAVEDPFASGKLPTQNKEGYWDNRDAGWGDYGPHKLAEDFLAKADEDKDKQLSRDEFVEQVTKDDPALPSQEAEIMFADMDEDYDKKISIRELTVHMDEFEGNQAETEFYNTDTNGDSKVDVEEFIALYDASKSKLADEKRRARFLDVDTNKDGGVDVAEAKEHWDIFQPDDGDGDKVKKQRKKKGINRGKVTERAKGQLQAVFRSESDKAELSAMLGSHGLTDVGDKLKGMGIENVADLGHLTESEINAMGLKPVEVKKLLELAGKFRLKTGKSRRLLAAEDIAPGRLDGASATSTRAPSRIEAGVENRNVRSHGTAKQYAAKGRSNRRSSRKLLQTDPAVGDEGSAGGGAERRDDSDVPLDDVEIPEGVDVGGGDDEDGPMGDMREPDAHRVPKDGQEFVDGETYSDDDDEGFDDPYDYYHDSHHRYYDDYDDYPYDEDAVATEQARERYEQKVEGWNKVPLSHNSDSQWGHMKGFFAPEAPDSEDLAFRGEHIQKTILGHDEVFTRMMSIDKDVLLTANRQNKSAPIPGARPREEGYVYVDPHVLCTPIIADIDKDGADEVIFAVSYYFDKEQYSDPSAFTDLDVDVNTKKYVAGGVAAFDVLSGKMKWHTHLDLTTDETAYRAYIYSSPTVADIDNDGKLEIILGTSLGFLYVLDHKGEVKEGWPVTMAEIQGQVAVGDVNDDGQLELVATDNRFNVAVFNWRGKEVWEKRISGFSAQGPILGDINGDGEVDIVLCTSTGHIWALNGKTGETLHNFPVKAGGAIMSPPLLLQMKGPVSASGRPVRHVVVPSHDGYLYIVDGVTGCSYKVDIGENSYSMVLADDLTGNGKMDLLVTTMNGNIVCLGTDVDYHPLKAWPSREMGNNNVEMRDGRMGIYVLDQYRHHHDNSGATMMVGFEIVDQRPVKGLGGKGGRYRVRISVGGNLNLFTKEYESPGKYLEEVPCPARRQYSTIFVEMTNEVGQHFEDHVAMSFNMHFYRALKWILLTPFIAMSGALVFIKDMHSVLPI